MRRSRAFTTLVGGIGAPRYLRDDEELWARSYGQLITMRGGSQTLQAQVIQSREPDPRAPVYFGQWDDDFERFPEEIARLFRRLGWTD